MITGFNTDVEYEGVTYHVQTEDKGVETPLILSLVYDRGTILASKRSPYEDLLKGEFSEKTLAERLQKQHKLICAAVRGGRLEDLKKMTVKDSAARKTELQEPKTVTENSLTKNSKAEISQPANSRTEIKTAETVQPAVTVKTAPSVPPPQTDSPIKTVPAAIKSAQPDLPISTAEQISRKLAEKIDHAKAKVAQNVVFDEKKIQSGHHENNFSHAPENLPIPKPLPVENRHLLSENIDVSVDDLIVEAFEVTEADIVLEAEAVAVIGDFTDISKKSPEIGLLNETEFKGGDRKTVSIIVWRGTREDGIADAQIMVKVLGSSFRPMIFHARSDANGVATVHLQLPHFRSGRAAILIRAITGGEEIEMRRVISHG